MNAQIDLFPHDAAAELAYAKTCVEGMELSPEAQALYEREGADRFRKFHGKLFAASPALPQQAEGEKP
jgi:hypothetical protein